MWHGTLTYANPPIKKILGGSEFSCGCSPRMFLEKESCTEAILQLNFLLNDTLTSSIKNTIFLF